MGGPYKSLNVRIRVESEPNQFKYNSKFDSTIKLLNIVYKLNELNIRRKQMVSLTK